MPTLNDGLIGQKTVSNTITAKAGGVQATAVLLTSSINQVSVCATAADAVVLPQAPLSAEITVINDGVAALQVFGSLASADTINSVVTGTGVSVPAAKRATFTCYQGAVLAQAAAYGMAAVVAVPGKWAMILSA